MQSSYLPFIISGVVGMVVLSWIIHGGQSAKDAIPVTTGPASEQLPKQVSFPAPIQAVSDEQGVGDKINALQKEIALLKTDLGILWRQLKEQATNAPAGAYVAPSPAATIPFTPGKDATAAYLLEEEKRKVEERMQTIESSIQNESLDRSWSTQVSDLITQIFASEELAGTSLEHVECRSTLCRVEVTHDDPRSQSEFAISFLFKVAQFLPRLAMRQIDNSDGSISTLLYLAREGYRLPQAKSAQ